MAILEDVGKRPYITVGFTALLLLVPLAVTSTKGWIRRLGGKRWNAIHRLVYPAAALGVLHYLWAVKADTRKPIVFALVLVALLAARLPRVKSRSGGAGRGPTPGPDPGKKALAVGAERG